MGCLMSEEFICETEKRWIVNGLICNIRNDGRRRNESRPIEIQTMRSITNGLAQVRMGVSEIIIGSTCSLCLPAIETPKEGHISFDIKNFLCTSKTIADDKRKNMIKEIQSFIGSLSNYTDTSALCVVPYRLSWGIHLECLILATDCNIL